MAGFKTLSTEYDVTKRATKGALKLALTDSLSVKGKLSSGGGRGVEVGGKAWTATYDLKSKDAELECKWKVGKAGELKIKQKVPGLMLALVPSPEVQWKQHVVKVPKVFAWEVEPSYDFLGRKGKLEQTIEIGTKQKVKFDWDSKTRGRGLTCTLSSKAGSSWAKQLSLKYSRATGPSLTHEMEPAKQLSVKSTVGLRARDLKVVAELKPGKVAGVKPKLTLEGKVSAKAPLRPAGIIAGLSIDC